MASNKKLYFEKRLKECRKLLISGETRFDILNKLLNSEYDWWPDSGKVRRTNLTNFIKEAADTCKFETQAAMDEQKALHLERYLELYRECRKNNDRSNARAILSDIAKLMGLNSPDTLSIDATSYRIKLV